MEKLIELLNEYENRDDDQEIEWRVWEWDEGERGKVRWIVNEVYMWWVSELVVCSAHYWFIKWLVENEKIDLYKIPEIWNSNPDYIVWEVEIALMELAIQDEPIEFLISILK